MAPKPGLGATILLGAVNSKITGQYPAQALYDSLSYKPQGYEFSPAYREHRWDGKKRLFSKRGIFPTGLLNQVLDVLDDRKITWELDKSQYPQPQEPLDYPKAALAFRPYQEAAVEAAVREPRGILKLPTGAGKTEVAAGIIARTGQDCLFIVPTRDLMYQAKERFEKRLNVPIGQLGDGKYIPSEIVVATMQSAAKVAGAKFVPADDESDWADEPPIDQRASRFIAGCGLVIIDEAQHASCETMRDVLNECRSACWILGLSATPWRDDGDDMLMEGVISEPIYEITATELIKQGYLVPPIITTLKVPAAEGLEEGNFAKLYRDQVVENRKRHLGVAELAHRFAGQGLVLVLLKQVKHGEAIYREIKSRTSAVFLSGRDPGLYRTETLEKCRRGDISVLIATTLADEGLDLPNIGTVILAGGGKAAGRALQRVGRALRPWCWHHRKKEAAFIFDLVDDIQVFRSHARARLNAYRTEPAFQIKEESWIDVFK